jgi:hypothetical protein
MTKGCEAIMKRHQPYAFLTAAIVVATCLSKVMSAGSQVGTPPISLGPAANVAAGSEPSFVAISDLNDDGKLDLAVANRADNNVSM